MFALLLTRPAVLNLALQQPLVGICSLNKVVDAALARGCCRAALQGRAAWLMSY